MIESAAPAPARERPARGCAWLLGVGIFTLGMLGFGAWWALVDVTAPRLDEWPLPMKAPPSQAFHELLLRVRPVQRNEVMVSANMTLSKEDAEGVLEAMAAPGHRELLAELCGALEGCPRLDCEQARDCVKLIPDAAHFVIVNMDARARTGDKEGAAELAIAALRLHYVARLCDCRRRPIVEPYGAFKALQGLPPEASLAAAEQLRRLPPSGARLAELAAIRLRPALDELNPKIAHARKFGGMFLEQTEAPRPIVLDFHVQRRRTQRRLFDGFRSYGATPPRAPVTSLTPLAERSAMHRNTVGDFLADEALFAWRSAFGEDLRYELLLRIAELQLLIDAYAAREGAPPASIDALVGTVTEALPLDPVTGAPLRSTTPESLRRVAAEYGLDPELLVDEVGREPRARAW